MKRRDLLKSLPFAGVATLVPAAIEAAPVAEDAWGKADRLAWELSEALENLDGRWTATVYGDFRPTPVVFQNDLMPRSARLTPKARAEAAISELRAAMADLGHDQWMAMIREESATHGGGFANALIFDGSGTCENQINLA